MAKLNWEKAKIPKSGTQIYSPSKKLVGPVNQDRLNERKDILAFIKKTMYAYQATADRQRANPVTERYAKETELKISALKNIIEQIQSKPVPRIKV